MNKMWPHYGNLRYYTQAIWLTISYIKFMLFAVHLHLKLKRCLWRRRLRGKGGFDYMTNPEDIHSLFLLIQHSRCQFLHNNIILIFLVIPSAIVLSVINYQNIFTGLFFVSNRWRCDSWTCCSKWTHVYQSNR